MSAVERTKRPDRCHHTEVAEKRYHPVMPVQDSNVCRDVHIRTMLP